MSLRADLAVERNGFRLDLSFSAPSGEVLALVGQNGAGKSTVLAAIAGLIPLRRGEVVLDDRLLERVATGVRLPPQAREIGVLFQGLALFDHLSAVDNVAMVCARVASIVAPLARARATGCSASGSPSWASSGRRSSRVGRRSGSRWPAR